MSGIQDLYQEVILHHSKRPRNFGALEDANRKADGHNPLCGDRLQLSLRVEDGVVEEARFEGQGCAISTASVSVMTDAIKGRRAEDVLRMFRAFHGLVTGEDGEGGQDARETPEAAKLEVFAGVRAFPVRVKCAMLAWRTLEAALADDHATVTTE